MRKNNLKMRIAGLWAINIVAYIIAALIVLAICIKLDVGIGFCVILSTLGGLLLISPLAIRNENLMNHYKRLIKKENKSL